MGFTVMQLVMIVKRCALKGRSTEKTIAVNYR
jgi:hypothetical protein